jgi:hypothetical protein
MRQMAASAAMFLVATSRENCVARLERYSKRRRYDRVPLHPAVAQRLRDWLATKGDLKPNTPLFPVGNRRTALMMKLDLERAGIPYEDEMGRVADFHANRHTFISNLGRAGIAPKVAQTLARHSDVNLTMNVYSHVELSQQAAAIGRLPAPPPLAVSAQADASDTESAAPGEKLALWLAQTPDFSCPEPAAGGTEAPAETAQKETPNPLLPLEFGVFFPGLTPDVISSGGGTRTPDTRIMIPLL